MKTGRLSFTVGEAGERRIDTAELDRVFGVRVNGATADAMAPSMQRHVTPVREIEALQRLLDDRETTYRDLRARLDAEAEERRRLVEREAEERRRLLALLTDQRSRPWW